MINYNIKGTGIAITDELRAYVEKRFAPVEKFITRGPAHLDVELEHAPLRDGERYRAEFTLQMLGEVYRAEHWGETIHATIDTALGQLALKLDRGQKKFRHILRRSGHKVKEYLRGWRERI